MSCKFERNGERQCPHPDYSQFPSGEWCPFHAPLAEKAEWTTHERNDFILVMQNAGRVANGDMTGVQLPDWANVERVNWPPSRIVLDLAIIEGDVRFMNRNGLLSLVDTDIRGGLILENCKLSDGLSADGLKISGPCQISGCSLGHIQARNRAEFCGGIEFQNNCTLGEINFDSAVFGNAENDGLSFNATPKVTVTGDSASFQKCEFLGAAHISAKFMVGTLDFRNAEFHGQANFTGAVFGHADKPNGLTYFDHAIFHQDAIFSRATFDHPAHLRDLEICGDLELNNAVFNWPCTISSTQNFKGVFATNAHFHEVSIAGVVEGPAVFRGAVFSGPIKIDSEFRGTVSFFDTEFRANADFAKVKFLGGTNFSTTNKSSFQSISFEKGVFVGPVTFEHRSFDRETSFAGTKFTIAPSFYHANLHPSVTFGAISDFSDFSKKATKRYQALRLKCEELRSRHEEGLFHALEQRSRRICGDLPRTDWFFSIIYDRIALYGTSIFRPLLSLFILLLAWTGLFALIATEWHIDPHGEVAWASLGESFVQSARNIIVPFFQFRQSADGMAVVHLIESLFAVPLLAVFFLAIRWRFRRG